jgi:hypothetical protein
MVADSKPGRRIGILPGAARLLLTVVSSDENLGGTLGRGRPMIGLRTLLSSDRPAPGEPIDGRRCNACETSNNEM